MFDFIENANHIKYYPDGIKRVAICFYGCYRSGDYTLPKLKQWFSSNTVDVDIFCSIKDYDDFSNAWNYESDNTKTDISDKLKFLNPKRISILTQEDDASIFHSTQQRGVYSIVDSIMQKQIYEMETNTEYDLVFVLRYDMIFRFPEESILDRVIKQVESFTYGTGEPTTNTVFYDANNRWIATWTYQMMTRTMLWNPTLHDCSFYGSNAGINSLAYYMSQHILPNDADVSPASWAHGVDLHHLMHHAFGHADIQRVEAEASTKRFKIIRP